MPETSPARPTTGALLKYFLYLGSLGFGGPVALVGSMQRDLVERRRWFTKDEYLFVVIPFPWFDRISENVRVKVFVGGLTAAASGAIAGACVVLARRALVDAPTMLIAAAALGASLRFKVPEPVFIAAGAVAGFLIFAVR